VDIDRNLSQIRDRRKQQEIQAQENYAERSAERLRNSIERHFRTTFIGALSAFEDAYGWQWGHRLPPDQLTNDELKCRRQWEAVRTQILNNGNGQLRAALMELSEYDVKWKRHRLDLEVRQ
jgi:hypothetical protein